MGGGFIQKAKKTPLNPTENTKRLGTIYANVDYMETTFYLTERLIQRYYDNTWYLPDDQQQDAD